MGCSMSYSPKSSVYPRIPLVLHCSTLFIHVYPELTTLHMCLEIGKASLSRSISPFRMLGRKHCSLLFPVTWQIAFLRQWQMTTLRGSRTTQLKEINDCYWCKKQPIGWKYDWICNKQKEVGGLLFRSIYIILLLRSRSRKNVSISQKYWSRYRLSNWGSFQSE